MRAVLPAAYYLLLGLSSVLGQPMPHTPHYPPGLHPKPNYAAGTGQEFSPSSRVPPHEHVTSQKGVKTAPYVKPKRSGLHRANWQTQKVQVGPNEYFNLRWPRPKPTPGPSFGPKVFQRTWNDTCGLYTWSIDTNPTDGRGPPPHIHWADDEWFFPRGAGSEVRIYTTQNPQTFLPGMLPGITVPTVPMGFTVVTDNQVLFAHKYSLHYYRVERSVKELWIVLSSGLNIEPVVPMAFTTTDPEELLQKTALLGQPTDSRGIFVGRSDFQNITGPVYVSKPYLQKLQKLFDMGEACYPN